ncbi:hypothetical protein C5167_003223 [Papaver somniferum]|uniref:Uncharacterized protein n=1 Tax=Papaver somniferum TaxID=3469 RepID=A0A4Y7L3N7_PAPSO|nr:uncharacterized protein LOC113313194 [Papaver somniferum]RZC79038.1 hypothetical protein C5167_003223 [Papaver somniferum]
MLMESGDLEQAICLPNSVLIAKGPGGAMELISCLDKDMDIEIDTKRSTTFDGEMVAGFPYLSYKDAFSLSPSSKELKVNSKTTLKVNVDHSSYIEDEVVQWTIIPECFSQYSSIPKYFMFAEKLDSSYEDEFLGKQDIIRVYVCQFLKNHTLFVDGAYRSDACFDGRRGGLGGVYRIPGGILERCFLGVSNYEQDDCFFYELEAVLTGLGMVVDCPQVPEKLTVVCDNGDVVEQMQKLLTKKNWDEIRKRQSLLEKAEKEKKDDEAYEPVKYKESPSERAPP